jgi:hypothetical protein
MNFEDYLTESVGHTDIKKHLVAGGHTVHGKDESNSGSKRTWLKGSFDSSKIHAHMKKIEPQAKHHDGEVSGTHNGVKYNVSKNDEGYTVLHTSKSANSMHRD